MEEAQAPTAEGYLAFRTNVLLGVLKQFLGGSELAKINFLISLDFWDWELECIMEALDGMGMIPKLTGINRVIPVKVKGDKPSLHDLRRDLLMHWNAMVQEANKIYDELDDDDKDGLGFFMETMDFDVYYK
jgi:hypothetical protein